MDECRKGREEEEDIEREEDEMSKHQSGPWMSHGEHGWGGMGWHWKKCGCPACRWLRAMRNMSMMSGMMPGMGMGMMGGMGMQGMMGMAPWRKFVSSDEKIAGLEKYLKDLQMEEKAVQEKIDVIRNKYQK